MGDLHSMQRQKYISHVTFTGSLVNLGLVVFKFAAGILGHSSAMIADAAHSLSDFVSDLALLWCVRLSSRPNDEDHSYGHGKYETVAAISIALLLLATGLGLFWSGAAAIAAFFQGQALPQPEAVALIAAILSLLIKEGLYQYTMRAARRVDSNALKANAWHHRSDAITSLATLAGIGGAMWLGPGWAVLDPLACCLISLFIIGMAWSISRPAFDELVEKSLPPNERAAIEAIVSATPGVVGYHRLRTRRLGAGRAVELHIQLDGEMPLRQAHDIASGIERSIKAALGAKTHVGIHMEPGK